MKAPSDGDQPSPGDGDPSPPAPMPKLTGRWGPFGFSAEGDHAIRVVKLGICLAAALVVAGWAFG